MYLTRCAIMVVARYGMVSQAYLDFTVLGILFDHVYLKFGCGIVLLLQLIPTGGCTRSFF